MSKQSVIDFKTLNLDTSDSPGIAVWDALQTQIAATGAEPDYRQAFEQLMSDYPPSHDWQWLHLLYSAAEGLKDPM
jgi:hypothetical protein